jgi:hypothetical protein
MTESTILQFPKRKHRPAPGRKSPDQLASEVRAAWRKLGRAIKAAQYAGLEVDLVYDREEPKITRRV